jgi:hypothetical protein
MLAKRPDDRPATAAEVGQRLACIANGLHGSAYDRLDVSVFTSVHGAGMGKASGRSANRVGD